jgi:hypothetical protein
MSESTNHNDPFPEMDPDPLVQDDIDQENEELEEAPPTPPVGNRPATGARQVMPGEVFAQDFTGADNAGDFLGLDTDFTEALTEAELDLAQPPSLGIEEPAPTPAAKDYDAEFDLDGPTQIMHADDAYDDGPQAEYEGEYPEDLDGDFLEEGLEGELAEAPSGGRGRLLAGAFVVALVAVLGATLGPKFLNKDDAGAGSEIARGPSSAPTTDPVTDPTPDPVEPGDVDPVAIDPVQDPEPALADVEPAIDPVEPDPVDTAGFPEDFLTALEDPVSDPAPSPGLPDLAALFGVETAEPVDAFPNFEEGGYEWVSDDMLDMVWRGRNVPMEAISAPARTLMPRVGPVRVHMDSGETIEGRLYAVGQDRVWLDVDPGRIGLDGDAVVSFEHLPMEASLSSVPVLSGDRVRVRVPGGSLYGRVFSREGDVVTLISDEGGRVSLRDVDVEPLGTRRAILVERN